MCLAWVVVSRGLVAHLAATDPNLALRLNPGYSGALVRLADIALQTELSPPEAAHADRAAGAPASDASEDGRLNLWAKFASRVVAASQGDTRTPPLSLDPKTAAQIRAWARQALIRDPLNAGALRILGQVADAKDASKLMQAAVRRSIRESIAVYWLMQKSTNEGDFASALHYADILLRTQSNITPLLMPTLAKIVESRPPGDVLKALLVHNPPWRAQFFQDLPTAVGDPRALLEIFLALRGTPAPPTSYELGQYLHFLIGHRDYDLARYTWLQFLPPERLRNLGFLYNGSFEQPLSGLPFDWEYYAGSGVTIDIAQRPGSDHQHALFLEFGEGRVDFKGVSQLLMLPPGEYRLTGKYRGTLKGRRGLVWRIACDATAAQLGTSPMVLGSAPSWQTFEVGFKVPVADCPAQRLQLDLDARSESEQLISGSIWYDDLNIARTQTN